VLQDVQPFFERSSTKRAIRELAGHDSVLLVLGAGVSADSGLPPWRSLMDRVLLRVGDRLGIDHAHRAAFADALIEHHGYLTAGSLAQSILGHYATLEAVRTALYEGVGYDPQPYFHANVVADFVVHEIASGQKNPPIVTTNYDRLVEMAISARMAQLNQTRDDDAKLQCRPLTVVTKPSSLPEDAVPVYHIHGCVAPRWDAKVQAQFVGQDNTILLGEQDYARLQYGGPAWQDEVVFELLSAERPALFTGMSLADPNIVRYLTMDRPVGSGERYALLSRQSEQRWVDKLPAGTQQPYNDALYRRLSALRVKPIRADYYVQVAQFLSEVLLYRQHATDWRESMWYGNRLRDWRRAMEAVLLSAQPDEFTAAQRALNAELNRVIEYEISPLLEADGMEISPSERLSLELWYRNSRSSKRSLELWGSSVGTLTAFEDLKRPAIAVDRSPYSAVEAFKRGGSQFRKNGRKESRWQYQLCQLIRLPREPWFNLPVGVVVLSSSEPYETSSLAKLTDGARTQLQQLVEETGVQLADPDTVGVALSLGS
jgi:hypothetical protein